jgi:hypothetical protein
LPDCGGVKQADQVTGRYSGKPAIQCGIIQFMTDVGADATSQTKEVFISYGSADRGVAGSIADRLASQGFKVWYDRDEIRPGDRWGSAIFHGLRSADAVLLLLSDKPQDSFAMQFELGAAIAEAEGSPSKRIIPVLLPGSTPPTGLLAPYQYVDARDGDLTRVVDQVVAALQSSPPRDKKHDRAIELEVLRGQHDLVLTMESRLSATHSYELSLLTIVLAGIAVITSLGILLGLNTNLDFSSAFWAAVVTPLLGLLGVLVGFFFGRRNR